MPKTNCKIIALFAVLYMHFKSYVDHTLRSKICIKNHLKQANIYNTKSIFCSAK